MKWHKYFLWRNGSEFDRKCWVSIIFIARFTCQRNRCCATC